MPPPPPTSTASLPEKVSFNEHIQPILSEYCYHCHGPPPISPPSSLRRGYDRQAGPAQWLFQGPPAESKLLAVPSGMSHDWRDWKGGDHGYEGMLVENYHALLAVLDDVKTPRPPLPAKSAVVAFGLL